MNSELNQSVMLEAEVFGIQNVAQTDHSKLENLDYEHSGHTGFQPAGNYVEDSNYVHTDNNYTTEEKNKLANLENYDDTEIKADISALEDIEETQNQEIANIKANKADKSEIPDVSDFITKSVDDLVNYYKKSETYTQSEINSLIGSISSFEYEIVQTLPTTGSTNIMYLVPRSTSETGNTYDEYLYVNGWEKIGSTDIDLSGYVTTTQLNTALANYTTTTDLTTLLAGKQDNITSTNKLDSSLVDDSLSNNKFVTPAEKTTWNNKSDFSGDYDDLTNKPTIPTIPTNISAFTNDVGYISTETDPVFSNSPASGITSNDMSNWNSKQNALTFDSTPTQNSTNPVTSNGIFEALQNAGGGDANVQYLGNIRNYSTSDNSLNLNDLEVGSYLLRGSFDANYIYIKATINGITQTRSVRNSSGILNNALPWIVLTLAKDINTETINGEFGYFEYISYKNNSMSKAVVTLEANPSEGLRTLTIMGTGLVTNVIDTNTSQSISGLKTFTLLPRSSINPTLDNQLTRKGYVDALPTTYSGYDASKTQVLKNINGTLTWVDE